jgi:hypothetical protein
MTEGQRLSLIRDALAAIAPGQWSLAADAEGEFVEAEGAMGELLPLCRIHPGATVEEKRFIADAVEHVRFLLGLVDRAIRFASRGAPAAAQPAAPAGRGTSRDARSGLPSAGAGGVVDHGLRGKDYAAEAAMKCAEPAFRVFLEERHGLERPLTEERVAQKVRSLCGVVSRRELNEDGEAAAAAIARWRSLVRDFDAWRRAGK